MNHSFDTDVAAKYGLVDAIILENFKFWIAKNEADERHQYEGRYWTYSSVKALETLFAYLTAKQIRGAIDRLVEAGILLKGNFNQSAYDRTSWFAFSEIDLPSKANGKAPQGKRLTTTDITQIPGELVGFASFWKAWPKSTRKGGKDKCLEVWKQKGYERDAGPILAHVATMAASKDWQKDGGQFVPAPVVYLRSTAWTGAELDLGGDDRFAGAI